ncbi:fimbrillin family protein [Dysgonomonas sp. 216]|uniref:fimbrillin family protein n=1 Tax=Dysgonomonas sp. 216 TaxID=2302934 RepID=UPI0013D12549|nr:fimbrillin family protein [Dysgonomonas sp. 216]NDW18770.1 fimbrillin family protein [Dysgonomonas sp. 216]
MKKLLFMTMTAMLVFASCNDHDESATVNENASLLSITTEINTQQKSLRSGPMTAFADGSTLSLFVCAGTLGTPYPGGPYDNIKASFDGNTALWSMERPVRLTSENASVYALYPYMPSLGNGVNTAQIEHTSQTDYMFGTNAEEQQAVNHNNPRVRLRMNHALTLLQFRLSKHNYDGQGKVTRLAVGNETGRNDLRSAGTLSITNGDIYTLATEISPAAIEDTDGLYTIPDVTPGNNDYLNVMILPVANTSANGSVQFHFTIDGRVYTYNVPANTTWKQSTKYIYEVTLNGTELQIADVIITDWIDGPVSGVEIF